MGGAQSASKSFLREEYKNKEACQLAAGASAAGLAADAFNSTGVQSMSDKVGQIALMRCMGKSYTSIILYHVILLCIVVACAVLIPLAIPDSVWENCSICTRSEPETVHNNGRATTRQKCVESRQGTPQECRRQGRIFEYIIGTIVGLIITAIISGIYTFYLKSKVFTSSALITDTVGRVLL